MSKSTFYTNENDSDSSKKNIIPIDLNSNLHNKEEIKNVNERNNKKGNKNFNEKLFFNKKYTQTQNKWKYLLSCIAISLLCLPYYGFAIFLVIFYYSNLNTRIIFLLLAILQNFIPSGKNKYFEFIKSLNPVKYFKSFTMIIEEELNEKNSIFPSIPHGIMSWIMALHILQGHPILRKFHTCGTRYMIYLPITGIFSRLIGIEAVNNGNFKNFLEQGENIVFIPGGWECATLTDPNRDRTYLKNRKGFIKYALTHGSKVHPVYNFGENKLFSTFKKWKFLDTIGLLLNKLKFPGVLFLGKFLFLPFSNVDCCSVIGRGIQFPKINNPTIQDVDNFHKIYIENVVNLYDRYKKEYGASETLEIL